MRVFNIFIIIFLMAFPSQSFSQVDTNSTHFLEFQVVQSQFVFDHKTIKNASLITHHNGTFRGLHLELKRSALNEFERMTNLNRGKRVNIVFDKKIITSAIIQTPLGGSLLISGISQEEAQEFIDSLKKTDHS
jgi:preprotein translocase subunit SecD